MQQRLIKLVAATLFGTLGLPALAAQEQPASREDAVQFVNKAISYMQKNGKESALSAFNQQQGQFVEHELYIVVLDLKGQLLADGSNPKLVGKSMVELRDVNGKYFVKEELELAKSKGRGWVDFEWLNPLTKKMESRSSYFERIDDYIVLTGVYQAR